MLKTRGYRIAPQSPATTYGFFFQRKKQRLRNRLIIGFSSFSRKRSKKHWFCFAKTIFYIQGNNGRLALFPEKKKKKRCSVSQKRVFYIQRTNSSLRFAQQNAKSNAQFPRKLGYPNHLLGEPHLEACPKETNVLFICKVKNQLLIETV
jgi:hypothetical protein